MCLRITVRSLLSAEVPPLHDALEPFALACSLYINPLTKLEVSRTQKVPNWQEILRSDWKLGQVSLWWQPILQIVASLWLLDLVKQLFTASNLDGVETICLLSLNLDDLAPVNLEHSTRHMHAPSIPEMSASDLVA